ncbi:hypothetical protein NPIL_545991 [Nephila pilipes]|uniref:Uncharacterized protein n=1 Tax=Nephila pilipes TaxID=299642 RepID=A0A8X6TBW2_NEPPI|nr:hypothetical protein NPIL_545991 [Nephila pilipes]
MKASGTRCRCFRILKQKLPDPLTRMLASKSYDYRVFCVTKYLGAITRSATVEKRVIRILTRKRSLPSLHYSLIKGSILFACRFLLIQIPVKLKEMFLIFSRVDAINLSRWLEPVFCDICLYFLKEDYFVGKC